MYHFRAYRRKFHRAATGGAREWNVESVRKAMVSYFAKTG